jgi:ATP-dependent DNA helicase UvrD/PcrA
MRVDLLSDLNEPQRQAVTHVDGPLLVLAGAGSGKTRVITRRVAHLIAQGVAPWNILAITFTNKAAGEMRERVERLNAPPGATLCTFHALCARLLREFAAEVGLTANYTIYDRDDQIRLVKEALAGMKTQGLLSPQIALSKISNAKNSLETAESFAQGATGFEARSVADVYGEYQRLLQANNAMDFDDLLVRTAFLLRDHPEVRDLLTDRYRYVLIDEYQDTNRAQYIIAHGIAAGHGNVCVTGDPDQSIYAWRGADISNILEFEADYPNATVIRLEENYRSTRPILSAASNLISHNVNRKDKALWTRREGGRDVHVWICDHERAEAQAVVQEVVRHRAEGGDYADVAFFYRVNALSRTLEETLVHSGIPYRIARGVEFYNRKEIRDVLAYLRLLVNPADDLSCQRIINTPTRGIGATTVKRLKSHCARHACPLITACGRGEDVGLGKAAAKKVAAFHALITSLASPESLGRPVREIMEDVVQRTGLHGALEDREDQGRQATANVAELVTTAAQFDQQGEEAGTLADYLHQVSLVSDVDHMEGGSGAVTLMTLHAAKGLEFPVVFMIGCEEGLLPFQRGGWGDDARRTLPQKDLEEERRLAFVGMTRAQRSLTLTGVRRRTLRGRVTPQPASRFLNEIGDENVTTEDRTTAAGLRTSYSGQRGGFYADMSERERIEAMTDDIEPAYEEDASDGAVPVPPEYEHLRKGSPVHHPQYGRGTVTRIHMQPWPDTRVEVFFENCGPKKLALAYAHLDIL